MMLKGLVLVLLVALVSANAGWYHCRNEGDSNDCCLGNSGRRYVRFGAGDQWTFTEVENACFQCSTKMFGDPAPGKSKSCWVSNKPLPNEGWTQCASLGGTCKLPNHRKIRFGPNPNTGYKSYYYMEGSGSIPCTTQFFGGDPQEQTNQKSCWYGPNSYTNDTWVKCANQGYGCNTPSSNAIYKVKYGNIIRDINAKSINCASSGFGSQGGGACFYNPNPTEFFMPTGSWSLVTYCPEHASCSYSMTFGVTSTTSEATTHTWSNSLTQETSEGMFFEKEKMSKTESESVTKSQENAYSVHASETCGANCKDTPAAMYQWIMETGEVNWGKSGGGNHISADFTTYSCLWECLNSTKYVPKCPPGYCKPNTNCQKCTN